jgi:hypothetical protein
MSAARFAFLCWEWQRPQETLRPSQLVPVQDLRLVVIFAAAVTENRASIGRATQKSHRHRKALEAPESERRSPLGPLSCESHARETLQDF